MDSNKIQTVFKIYKQNHEKADFINSIERIYRKATATAAVVPAAPKEDQDKNILENLGLDKETQDFAISKLEQKDKKMVTMLKCFNLNKDKSDLANSVTRYF